jgi:hypothetical protein
VATTANPAGWRRSHRARRSGPLGLDLFSIAKMLQVGGEFLGRRVPLGGLLRHRLLHDRFQVDGDRRVEPPQRRRILRGDFRQHDRIGKIGEDRRQREELVQRDAQRIDVAALVDHAPFAERLFGAHVPQGPHHLAAC